MSFIFMLMFIMTPRGKYVCFDLETTHLRTHIAGIVELAAIIFNFDPEKDDKPTIISSFSTLLQPKGGNLPGAVRIHGITDDMLEGKPTFGEIKAEFTAWLDKHTQPDFVYVGHNIRHYDVPILKNHFDDADKKYLAHKMFDTYEVARHVYHYASSKKLTSLYDMLAKTPDPDIVAHRALSDVKMSIFLACEEMKKLATADALEAYIK